VARERFGAKKKTPNGGLLKKVFRNRVEEEGSIFDFKTERSLPQQYTDATDKIKKIACNPGRGGKGEKVRQEGSLQRPTKRKKKKKKSVFRKLTRTKGRRTTGERGKGL